jgi:small neutral amino acid transporter SnatA (MarC family)
MENTKEIFAIILSIGGGAFSILASILNLNFFFESRKAQFFVRILGRNGARIFYSVLGLVLFFFAYKMLAE